MAIVVALPDVCDTAWCRAEQELHYGKNSAPTVVSVLAEPHFFGPHDEADAITLEWKKEVLELARGWSRIFPEAPAIAWRAVQSEQGIGQEQAAAITTLRG